jgi:hypothetical protein
MELSVRADDDQTPASLRRLYKLQLKLLAKPTTTLSQDVKTAAKIIPALEKKAGDDVGIITAATNALSGLTTAVTTFLAQVDADANALRMKKQDPLVRIDRYLVASHGALTIATSGATLAAKFKSLRTALLSALKANAAVVKAGGGGGGGGTACGPSPAPAGLRALAAGESFTAHVVDADRTYDFVAGSLTAKVGPQFGVMGNPTVLTIGGFDCTRQSSTAFDVPYPPTVNQTYQSGAAAAAEYRYVWDGFTELENFVSVKATAFDPQAKTITVEFSYGRVTLGQATVHGWQ